MKTLLSKSILVLLACAIIGSPIFAESTLDKTKKAIEDINATLVKASIAGDLDTIFTFYTDDIMYMPNYGPMIKGIAAVRNHEETMRAAGLKIHTMDFTVVGVWTCGNLVYEVGKYTISLTAPGTPEAVSDQGKYFTVWEKQPDGALKIKLEIWNTDMNPWEMMAEKKTEEKSKDHPN
jgi:ketosteroid isomerase-like protein